MSLCSFVDIQIETNYEKYRLLGFQELLDRSLRDCTLKEIPPPGGREPSDLCESGASEDCIDVGVLWLRVCRLGARTGSSSSLLFVRSITALAGRFALDRAFADVADGSREEYGVVRDIDGGVHSDCERTSDTRGGS